MKYYHFIGLSSILFAIQFLLQHVLEFELCYFLRTTFFILQAILFVSYSFSMFMYTLRRRNQQRKFQQKKTSSENNTVRKQSDPVYLKAS